MCSRGSLSQSFVKSLTAQNRTDEQNQLATDFFGKITWQPEYAESFHLDKR